VPSHGRARLATGVGHAVRSLARRHPVPTFVALAYLLSWAWWLPLVLAGATVRVGMGWPTHLPGLAGPAVSALIVTTLAEGRPGLRALGRRTVRWRVGGWWLSVLALLAVGAFALLATGGIVGADALTGYPGVAGSWGSLATLAFVFVVNGVGEELGWRGFAVERLSTRHSLVVTAVLIALAWAPWHLPLFFLTASFQAFAATDIAGWAFGLTAGSIVLAWLYRRSGGSVLLVSAWHTAFNLTSATPAASGAVAAASSTVVMVAAVAIVVVEVRGRRRRRGGA
jgi:membrane protease YdiL (CAAX protease family)